MGVEELIIDWLKPIDRCNPDEQNHADDDRGCWIYDEVDAMDMDHAREIVAAAHGVSVDETREHQD